MFLEESKTGNCDFLGIDTKDLGMLSNERKGENVSCPLPKLKSAMRQRTYHTSEKMTHKVVKKIHITCPIKVSWPECLKKHCNLTADHWPKYKRMKGLNRLKFLQRRHQHDPQAQEMMLNTISHREM